MSAGTGDFTRDPLVRAYAAVLRGHREAVGISRAKLAEALGYSPGWIEKLENAQKPPSEETSEDLDTYFKTPARTFHKMWTEIKREGKHLALPPGFPAFIKREAEASVMHIFDAMVLTGLFQTPAYAHEVLRDGRSPQEAGDLVRTRMERQGIFNKPGLAQIVLIIDEGVLHRPIGSSSVMKEQILHLITLTDDPRITLQVVPRRKGAYPGVMGAFTILGFDRDPDVVYIEGHTAGQLLERPSDVRRHALRFNLIRGAALSADQSLELLHATVESL